MARKHVSAILKDFRDRLDPGMGIDRFAKMIGAGGGSSLQRFTQPDYKKDQLPEDVIKKMLNLVGKGVPPITREEVLALALPPIVRGMPAQIVSYEGPAIGGPSVQVPVYAAAMGGKGHLIITIDPVEHSAPPEELLRVRDAYGILIVGESMVPAFEPGDIAWVNPHKPPQRNKDVVLYHVPPRAEAEAMVKRLVSFTGNEWKLRQYHPAKDFTESRRDWPVCHQIVGKRNA